MASPNLLQQLHHLDRYSSGFHDQLSNILYREGYKQDVEGLQNDGLVWLVNYLDEVRCCVSLPHLCLSQHRLSISSILPVPLSENVYAKLEAYVAARRYYRPRTSFHLHFSISVAILSPREVPETSSKGTTTV